MLHHQILPAPPTVEGAMDNVVVTIYNRSEFACNFEGWQEALQHELPSLLTRSRLSVAAAPSTDSCTGAVIHSLPLQLQPQRRKGKALVRSQGPTTSNAEFQGL